MKLNPRHRRSPKNLTVNDVFPDWKTGAADTDTGGIFYYLAPLHVPWETYTTENGLTTNSITWQLDIAYHGTQSGQKFVSPVVYNYLDSEGELSAQDASYLAAALAYRYKPKWQHLWDLYHLEYNPLDNYRIEDSGIDTVTENGESSHTRTPEITKTTTHPTKSTETTETRTPNLSEETVTDETVGTDLDVTEDLTHGHVIGTQEAVSDTVSNARSGFNSSTATPPTGVPTTSSSETKSDTKTESHSGKDTTETDSSETVDRDSTVTKSTTGTDKVETEVSETYTGTDTVVESGTDTTEGETSSTRETEYGHVRTGTLYQVPADMMDADRAFWLEDYFAIIFDDIDAFLTLSVYSEKPVKHKVFTD